MLQQENMKLKERKNKKRHANNKKEDNTEDSNYLGYNKNYVLNIEEDNDENKDNKIVNTHTNDFKLECGEDNENESEEYRETHSEISELKNELENSKIEINRLKNVCKNLENKIKVLREASSNLLIKINIPKKYKEEIKEILKLFDFTESEILFIVDKKKQYY